MKKTALILLYIVLSICPGLPTSTGKNPLSPDAIISRIEEKYEALSKSAPYVTARGRQVAQEIRFIQPSDSLLEDYSHLRQIALVRHGEPDMEKEGKFTSDEANQYLKCYDSVCIIVPEKPFFHLGRNEDVKVFSSPINRALTTAQYICGSNNEITVSPDFREFENKIEKTGTKKALPIRFWTTTSRIRWMLGRRQAGIESFSDAKNRAQRAAQTLADASAANPKILLTAHGMLNRYIKKDLKKMGWKVVKETGNNYFGTTILVKLE